MAANIIRPATVKLDETTKKRLKRIAELRHRSPHWMILEAVRQVVDREEKREAFRQDGVRAWREVRAAGLHVTTEEADAWLEKLEAGQGQDVPECHG